MLRRTRSTRKREIYTLIVPDGGLGGGVYGEGGLRRIRAEVMKRCASATNFRPAAVSSNWSENINNTDKMKMIRWIHKMLHDPKYILYWAMIY